MSAFTGKGNVEAPYLDKFQLRQTSTTAEQAVAASSTTPPQNLKIDIDQEKKIENTNSKPEPLATSVAEDEPSVQQEQQQEELANGVEKWDLNNYNSAYFIPLIFFVFFVVIGSIATYV